MAPMYTVSKHAVLGLMRSLAKTVPQDIKVTMIAPWYVNLISALIATLIQDFIRRFAGEFPVCPARSRDHSDPNLHI
jgi:NAD(P)-dependent dehydrogenase (short-subunit alcohol dehydrogenase family)